MPLYRHSFENTSDFLRLLDEQTEATTWASTRTARSWRTQFAEFRCTFGNV